MCSGPTLSQGQDSTIKCTTYLSAVCSFDQDSALVRRSDKTPAASGPAQVPDQSLGPGSSRLYDSFQKLGVDHWVPTWSNIEKVYNPRHTQASVSTVSDTSDL